MVWLQHWGQARRRSFNNCSLHFVGSEWIHGCDKVCVRFRLWILKLVSFCVNVGEQYPTNLSSAWDGRAALFGALPMDMPNFCGAVWHLLNDSSLDVVGFLFGAGAGFFFAAALAASELSFKLNLPLDMANMIPVSTQQHPKQATFETSPAHTVAPAQ